MKVRLEFTNGKYVIVNMDKNAYLTKNLQLYEIANNMGDPKLPQFVLNKYVDAFLSVWQDFRLWWNCPITPECGYRQPEWNLKVGGEKNSLHLFALAWDFNKDKNPQLIDSKYMAIALKWKQLCEKRNIVGECNFYSWGMHLGCFADKNGYRAFQCRDYRKPTTTKKFTLVDI